MHRDFLEPGSCSCGIAGCVALFGALFSDDPPPADAVLLTEFSLHNLLDYPGHHYLFGLDSPNLIAVSTINYLCRELKPDVSKISYHTTKIHKSHSKFLFACGFLPLR